MKNKQLQRLLIVSIILTLITSFSPINYPKVPDSPVRLFYIQRSANINTIVYDANLLPNGDFDKENPISVYWIRYQEQGQKKELTWIQNFLAYGISAKETTRENDFDAWVVSYKKKKLKVGFDKHKKPCAQLEINHKLARLDHVFVKTEGSNLRPKVLYVEVFGKDMTTGEDIYEKIKP